MEITRVWTSRSQPRDKTTGSITFDISFNVGEEHESWSRVPITALMDLEDKSIEYEEVTDAINNWVKVAKHNPFIRRNCVCCKNPSIKGKILCRSCQPIYGPTIEAEEWVENEPRTNSKDIIEREEDETAIRNSLAIM